MVKENLDADLKQESIDVVHRIGKIEQNGGYERNKKPSLERSAKQRWRANKGKGITIAEDMAPDLAKRLK